MYDAFSLLCNSLSEFSILTIPMQIPLISLFYYDASSQGVYIGAVLSVERDKEELCTCCVFLQETQSSRKQVLSNWIGIPRCCQGHRPLCCVPVGSPIHCGDRPSCVAVPGFLNSCLTWWALQLQQHSSRQCTVQAPSMGIQTGYSDNPGSSQMIARGTALMGRTREMWPLLQSCMHNLTTK